MTHPPYLREKARQMRTERSMTLDEIAERLALPKTTVWYWIEDLPAPPRDPSRQTKAARAAGEVNRKKAEALREAAYMQGADEFDALMLEPTFRDFVALYIAEGSKRTRHHVAICNSDPDVMALAVRWLRRLTHKPPRFSIQYHADQDLDEIRGFWAGRLGIERDGITLQRKSNSNQLTGRTWRSEHGVLAARVSDTYLRARMQAYMDCLRETWA